MKRFLTIILTITIVIIGIVEFNNRQLLKPLMNLSRPREKRVVESTPAVKVPRLKAPGDASRMSRQVVTKQPIRYHGFFNSKNQADYLIDIRRDALNDINYERRKRRLKPLRLTRSLNQVAKVRSYQADRHFSHYGRNKQALGCVDAVKLGVEPNYVVARSHLSECLSEQAGDVGNTAKQVAKTAVSGMIYHDAGSDWGHRKILLDPKNRLIGITAHYNKREVNKVVVAYDLYQ